MTERFAVWSRDEQSPLHRNTVSVSRVRLASLPFAKEVKLGLVLSTAMWCVTGISQVLKARDLNDPVNDPRTFIRSTMLQQHNYLGTQRQWACSYREVVRSAYESGYSTSAIVQERELLFSEDNPDDQKHLRSKRKPLLEPRSFAIWDRPLFEAILAHAVFSTGRRSHRDDGTSVLTYRFYPDPQFAPLTTAEMLAQVVTGEVRIDEDKKLFLYVVGNASNSLIVNRRLVVLGPYPKRDSHPIPLFQYYAARTAEAVVPEWWDEASFHPVPVGGTQDNDWLKTLSRVFVNRKSCKHFVAKSTVLPGFNVIEREQHNLGTDGPNPH